MPHRNDIVKKSTEDTEIKGNYILYINKRLNCINKYQVNEITLIILKYISSPS